MTDNELVITRTFDAPRSLVWQAWTDPDRLMRWWGPKDFSSPSCKIDLRVGGKYVFCMHSMEGQDYYSTGIFKEINLMERLVLTDSFADENGNPVSAEHYGMEPGFPEELLVTLTFEEHAGKTEMTLRHAGLPQGDISSQTRVGWNESFDKLAESLR